MKYNFVGDLHGKWEDVEEALTHDGHVVFVGDYMDSFDRSIDDQERTLLLVLDAIERGKATGLFGNHELSYLTMAHRCSGYNLDADAMIIPHKQRMINLLKTHLIIEPDWYITHAGVHPYVWEQQTLADVSLADTTTAEHWIGASRGGNQWVGGIWWCDFNMEFLPILGISQIFGHTSYGGHNIRTSHSIEDNTKNYCIDCLDQKEVFLHLDL